MYALVLLAGFCGVLALPAAQSDVSCTRDALYTSLSRDGRPFCSSVLESRCQQVTTPTQYATYDPTVISQHCKCVLTDSCKERTSSSPVSTTASGTGGSSTVDGTNGPTATSTQGDSVVTVTLTQTQTPSSGLSGSGTGTPIVITITSTMSFTSSETSTAISASTSGSGSATATSGSPIKTTENASSGPSSSDSGGGTSSSDRQSSSQTSDVPSGTSTLTSGSENGTSRSSGSSQPTDGSSASSSDSGVSTLTQTTTLSSSSGGGRWNSSSTFIGTAPTDGSVVTRTTTISSLPGKNTQTSGGSESISSSNSDNPSGSSTTRDDSITGTSTSGTSSTLAGRNSSTSATPSGSSATSGSGSLPTSGSSAPSSPGRSSSKDGSSTSAVSASSSTGTAPGSGVSSTAGGSASLSTGVTSGTSNSSTVAGSTSPGATLTPSSRSQPGSTTMLPNITTANPTGTRSGTDIIRSSLTPNATVSEPAIPAANFTQVTRVGAIAEETCYHLPQDPMNGRTRRAVLRNDEMRERNFTIPFPYVESVDFAEDGVEPLFLTLRDAARGTHYIDVSSQDRISIVDSLGNAMILDWQGIHFSTNSCRYDVSITVAGLYSQLATLSGQVCSKGRLVQRVDDTEFQQTVFLKDQCGNPVGRSVRKYPLLSVGETECGDVEVDGTSGRWVFDCTFPGSESGAMRCQRAVRNDIVKFLFFTPFGGSCPDLSTVITTLEATSQDFLNPESLRVELYDKGLTDAQRGEADLAIMYYEQLWEILKQAFSKSRTQPQGIASAIQEYVNAYDAFRNFEDDLCRELHEPDPPLNVSLRAGVSYLPAVASLDAPPRAPPPLNLTIQDSSKEACCPRGSVSNYGQGNGTCSYPDNALIPNSGCVCGRTAAGASIAFEYTECENFVARCSSDDDCAKEGHAGFLCLTGSCCGSGVCIDPYACSRNGTVLINSLI